MSFFLSLLIELYSFLGVNDNVIEIFLLRFKIVFVIFYVIFVFIKNIWKILFEKDNEIVCFLFGEIRVEMMWKLCEYFYFLCNIIYIVLNFEKMFYYEDKNIFGFILVVMKVCDYLL